jgi:hypothetical protein
MEPTKGEIWQDFIRQGIHPGQLTDNGSFDNFRQRSTQLRQDFIDRLLVEVSIANDEAHLKVLVYGYQTLLCYYINILCGYKDRYPAENSRQPLYDSVVKDLEYDLAFIQSYFNRYFDDQSPVPVSLRNECKKAIAQLDDQLTANRQLNIFYGDLHPLLINILDHHANGHLSFAKYYYMTRLVNHFLSTTAALRFPTLLDGHLLDFCVAHNVNAPEIIYQAVALLSQKCKEYETLEGKREWVSESLQQLYQISVDGGLLEGQPSVRDILANWLEQENVFLAVQKKESPVVPEQAPKLNTSVSVPVLALFTRLFKESGIITNSNLQEIFRFVSSNYTSQQKESISPGNFHGKYYRVEESTKRKVTDMLLEMVKVVKRIQ